MAIRTKTPSKPPAVSDHETDALYQLPLADFTAARNALAARLKKEGDSEEAAGIRALTKPSISAWAVNQLFWKERAAFDRLMDAGERLRRAGITEIREPLDKRRDAVTTLLRAAERTLLDAGHNPTSDIMRRVESTLEALSALPQAQPGRLAEDLAPPGFEELASLFAGSMPQPAGVQQASPTKMLVLPNRTDGSEKQIAEARESLREAERALETAQATSKSADTLLKEAETTAQLADARRNEAREQFERASAAADEAHEHARRIREQAKGAAKSLQAAELALEKARGSRDH